MARWVYAALLLVALVAAPVALAYAAHGHPGSGRSGGVAGNATSGAPGNATAGHGHGHGHGRGWYTRMIVNQSIEPDAVSTGDVFRVTLELVGNVTEARVVEVLPPWLEVVNATGSVEVVRGVVPARYLALHCPGCMSVHAAYMYTNATRVSAGNASGSVNVSRVEARVETRTMYWGVAELYMGNASIVNVTLTQDEPIVVIWVRVAYTPPTPVTSIHGIVILENGTRAPVRGETKLVVSDAINANVSVEGEVIRVKLRWAARQPLILAYTPGCRKLVIEAPVAGLRAAPRVLVYLEAYNDSGFINETLALNITAGVQSMNITIPAGAKAPCCIEYSPVNLTLTPPEGYEPLLAYSLGPSHDFGAELRIRVRLATRLAAGEAAVFYWNGSAWERLPTRLLDAEQGVIEYNTSHFTVFLIAYKPLEGQEEQGTTGTSTQASTTTTTTVTSTQVATTTTTTTTMATTARTVATTTREATTTTPEAATSTEAKSTVESPAATPTATSGSAYTPATGQESTQTLTGEEGTGVQAGSTATLVYALGVAALLGAAAAALLLRK